VLSNHTDLQATIYDTDTMRVLGSSKIPHPGAHEAVLMCSVYRLSDYLWRARTIGLPCSGTARDYRPIQRKLLSIGYPRNKGMRLQVEPLIERMRQDLHLPSPSVVKPTDVTLGLGSAMKLSYAVELFGADGMQNDRVVARIADPRFHQLLVKAIDFSGAQRFSLDHVCIWPARVKAIQSLRYDMCWRYPAADKSREGKFPGSRWSAGSWYAVESTEFESVAHEENYLDAACMVFEGQALRDVVDYRGAHGVRIVHNGVLDYCGVWVGKVGVGDATGGAVRYMGERMDDASRMGRQTLEVKLDKLPQRTTDLYFSLAANKSCQGDTFMHNISADVSIYQELSIRIVDSDNPGHELTSLELGNGTPSEAIVACCMTSDGQRGWGVSSISRGTQGTGRDYRPVLQCLRAIQAKKHDRPPEWPHQLPASKKNMPQPGDKKVLGPPRLGGGPTSARSRRYAALGDDHSARLPCIGPQNGAALSYNSTGSDHTDNRRVRAA